MTDAYLHCEVAARVAGQKLKEVFHKIPGKSCCHQQDLKSKHSKQSDDQVMYRKKSLEAAAAISKIRVKIQIEAKQDLEEMMKGLGLID